VPVERVFRESMRLVRFLIAIAAIALSAPAASGAATAHTNLSYDIDSPPAPAQPAQNMLDLYTPDGVGGGDRRPVVVYVHGGGWSIGDKANKIADKVALFTNAGYVFASVNYRLSPATGDPSSPDPARIRFPAHPHDVGEALGWLDRNVARYGGDPDRLLLIGHSAGAHLVSLVSTDPSYASAYGVRPWQIAGTASLDTDAFDITAEADPASPGANNPAMFWNAFATPAENAADRSWELGSPLRWADPADPPFLLVTSRIPNRLRDNQAMAAALGQDPASVVSLPYTHEQINENLGGAGDTAGETGAVMDFFGDALRAAEPPRVRLRAHPPRRVRSEGRRAHVRFRFAARGAGSFECRLDRKRWRRCRSPQRLAVTRGRHAFRVRALSDRGRPGTAKVWRFRVAVR
jgi:acetyl esterase/lipase